MLLKLHKGFAFTWGYEKIDLGRKWLHRRQYSWNWGITGSSKSSRWSLNWLYFIANLLEIENIFKRINLSQFRFCKKLSNNNHSAILLSLLSSEQNYCKHIFISIFIHSWMRKMLLFNFKKLFQELKFWALNLIFKSTWKIFHLNQIKATFFEKLKLFIGLFLGQLEGSVKFPFCYWAILISHFNVCKTCEHKKNRFYQHKNTTANMHCSA